MDEACVCWRAAWREGLAVALHHRMLVAFALLAVLCERALAFATGSTPEPAALLRALEDTFAALGGGVPAPSMALQPEPALLAFGLFLVGLFIVVGVLGLIRDLLVRRGYRPQDMVARGARYFWPVLKLKVSVYLGFGAVVVLLLSGAQAAGGGPWLWLAGGASALAFAASRVVLSLGDKILVTEEPCKVREVYRRLPGLLRPHLGAAMRFYAVMFAMMGAAVAAELALSLTPLSGATRLIPMVFLLAFSTVLVKAAVFVFYLQLAGRATRDRLARSTPPSNREKGGLLWRT